MYHTCNRDAKDKIFLYVYDCENEKYQWIYYFFNVTYVWKHAGRAFQEKGTTVNTVLCRLCCPVQNW